ncbi:TPM domain-containing protein [Cohnella pontilimi]|uniref:TPM domain-containing protein n=1 Tax=Cohnella pontilimi TaxID=2564100 RepID=UPI00145D8ECE|nr:TPM domain-containing protein [Cohnella pontilimi]
MAARRLKLFAAACLAALCLFSAAGGVWAAPSHSQYGVYVQDEADVISPQAEQELYNQAVWLEQKTGTAQIGVVTVRSVGDTSLEEAAVTKFRELGLGGRQQNDGVLLFYAKDENRVRLEIGYGMEGRIPDGKAGAILDQYFVPYRETGNLDNAFFFTQSAVIREMAAEYDIDASSIGSGNMPAPNYYSDEGTGLWASLPWYVKVFGGLILVFLLVLDFKFTGGAVTFAILNSIGRRGGGGGGRGGGWGGGRGGGGSSGGGGASR